MPKYKYVTVMGEVFPNKTVTPYFKETRQVDKESDLYPTLSYMIKKVNSLVPKC